MGVVSCRMKHVVVLCHFFSVFSEMNVYVYSFAKRRPENVGLHHGSTYLRESTACTRPRIVIAVSKDSSIAVAHQDPTGIIAIYRKMAVPGEYFLCARIKVSRQHGGEHCFVSHMDWVPDSGVRHRQSRFLIVIHTHVCVL